MNYNKIDVYNVLIEFFPDIRLSLTDNFIKRIRDSIKFQYCSFFNFAKRNNFYFNTHNHFASITSYLLEKESKRSAIKSKDLLNICKILKIPKNNIFKNITFFSVASGKKINLPKKLDIDSDLMYGLGLYIAEGKNDTKRRRRSSIANTEPEIIVFSIKWFAKYFNLNKKDLKFYITVPINSIEKEINDCITNKFKIKPMQISIQKNKIAKKICIEVTKDSKPLRLLIDWLKENLIILTLSNRKFAHAFVQGLFDGEGHIRNSKKIGLVFEMKNQLIQDTLKYLFLKEGITVNQHKDTITIEKRSFSKLRYFVPFRFNKARASIFQRQLNNIINSKAKPKMRKNSAFFNYLKILFSQNEFLSINELNSLAGHSYRNDQTLLKCLRDFYLNSYVKRKGNGTRTNSFRFKISDKGINYILEKEHQDRKNTEILKNNILLNIKSRWE